MRITATGGVVGLIAMAVSFGPTPSAQATGTVEADGAPVEFATQAGGPYEGMPLFDCNPDHLDRYLEVFFEVEQRVEDGHDPEGEGRGGEEAEDDGQRHGPPERAAPEPALVVRPRRDGGRGR